MIGILIDFGLAVAVAGLLALLLYERKRFEREFGRLAGKVSHQYNRFESHHRDITALQVAADRAKELFGRVKALESKAEAAGAPAWSDLHAKARAAEGGKEEPPTGHTHRLSFRGEPGDLIELTNQANGYIVTYRVQEPPAGYRKDPAAD